PLAGDSGIQSIASSLRQMIVGKIDGVTSGKTTLGEMGISFGAVGAKAGTANTLTLDETKFRAALENDPAGVANVLSAFRATATLEPGGTGGIASLSGDPTAFRKPGKYTIETTVNGDGTANITATFKPSDGGASTTTTLANVVAALDAGVRSFESSFGELGGCPVPRGATGNVASEDLVSMLHEMGYETGIDLARLLACAQAVQELLGRPLGSHLLTAGPIEWTGRAD
ncbi:MAG: flagellar filament capping protein FliD, partial [Thermoleophilum sp.]|nr:flagellar filament capping protein FliD [Thermoleophilum sp.]